MHTKCSTKTVQRAGWEQSGGGIVGLQRHCMYIARPWGGEGCPISPKAKKPIISSLVLLPKVLM